MTKPETNATDEAAAAHALAERYNIPINADLENNWDWRPRLTRADELIERPGSVIRYLFSQFDYLIGEDNMQANRLTAVIPRGYRTELAYWAADAPEKRLATHQGLGWLAMARMTPQDTYQISSHVLDGYKGDEFVLPPRSFYLLHALPESREPFAVSGFYKPPIPSLQRLEVEVKVDQKVVSTPDGEITVPYEIEELNRA